MKKKTSETIHPALARYRELRRKAKERLDPDVWGEISPLLAEMDELEEHILLERPLKWTTQIRDLGDPAYTLAEPIQIVIEEYLDDSIIARWPEVAAFGEGRSEPESLQNLKNAILDLYDDLIASDPTRLNNTPQMWLRILDRVIIKHTEAEQEMG